MRLIDANKFKERVAAMAIRDEIQVAKANAIIKLIDVQPTAIHGIVTKEEYAYQRKTYVQPLEHHYEEPGEKPYVKYNCPVCDAIGNHHQVTKENENCPLCNVNLCWKNQMEEEKFPFGYCHRCNKEFNSELINEYKMKFYPWCGKKIEE